MECFTQGYHDMAESGILKISNDVMVQKQHALFRVEEKTYFEKGEEATTIFTCSQLGYF